ncbi:hypothetical protein ACEZ7N_000594 [Salmonella enterica]
MDTNSELLPGKFPGMTEDDFDNISRHFWREAEQERPEDRQLKFRLMWLGEWLQRTHNWSIQHHRCTPMQALHYAIIRRHHWLPADVEKLTLRELSVALTEEWSAYLPACNVWLSDYVEKKLDWLDSPYRFASV